MRKRAVFSAHTKLSDKEKTHFSTAKFQRPTAPKLTSSCKFYPRKLTVSLQYTFSFSKNLSLASALQQPFRTDSKPFRRRFVGKTGYLINAGHFRHNYGSTGDLNRPRSPEVRKPLVCFLVLFAQRKKNKPVSLPGSFEVLQTSNQPTAVTSSHHNN